MGENWCDECSCKRSKVSDRSDIDEHENIPGFFRQVIQLLTDLVYFLACQENNGSDPFDVQILKPNRERQKLIREQNILKQVIRSIIVHCSSFSF